MSAKEHLTKIDELMVVMLATKYKPSMDDQAACLLRGLPVEYDLLEQAMRLSVVPVTSVSAINVIKSYSVRISTNSGKTKAVALTGSVKL